MDRLLTSDEVAGLLRVEVVTVRRLVARGELAAYRVGGEYRFTEADLENYLRRQRVAALTDAGRSPHPGPFTHLRQKVTPTAPRTALTEQTRTVLERAHAEAERCGAPLVSTDHLLVGLVQDPESPAVAVLRRLLHVELTVVGPTIVAAIPQVAAVHPAPPSDVTGAGASGSTLTLTAEKALHLGVEEAQRLKHPTVGPQHLLLGLLREGEGTAARALASLGVTLAAAREQVQQETRGAH